MSYEQIVTETSGRVGIITLNQPEKLNPMTAKMRGEIIEQIRAFNEDDDVGSIVLTGAGRGFCSGADIGDFEKAAQGVSDGPQSVSTASDWVDLVKDSKPIVCAINGVAVGLGVTLTLPCDVRVAAEEARLSFRFVRLGLTPEFGSSHYLVQLVGLGRALELMLTGRFVEAQEAMAIGLVTHVYPGDEMLDRAIVLAQEIAENPTWHLRKIKELVHRNYMDADLEKVLSHEQEVFEAAIVSGAHREALVAFRERREPRFH